MTTLAEETKHEIDEDETAMVPGDLVATSGGGGSAMPNDATIALPLDWTQMGVGADKAMPLRYPHDVADLSTEDRDICVVGTAGQKITQIPPNFSALCHPDVETLVFRSHLITKMQGLEGFTKLDTLELYDNQIQALESLQGPGPNLRVLDMSYNSIKEMTPVSLCANLTELYLANNKVKSIQGLSALVHLKKIDLGANRIRVIDETELGGLVHLEELWLGKNKIEEIRGLENLTKLRRLDVQSNRLTKIENLTTQQATLEELYLGHNGIDDAGASCESGLAMNFPKLNVIDLSRNRLMSTKPFAHLTGLEELWISGNQIETFDDVQPLRESAAAGTQSLETVYLEYNPVASEFEYRKRLKEWIPNLSQIDANLIAGVGSAGAFLSRPPMTPEQLQQAALDRARQQAQEQQQ